MAHSFIGAVGICGFMLFVSCSDNASDDLGAGVKVPMEFRAISGATRTTLLDGGNVIWQKNDAISLFDPSGNNNQFTTEDSGAEVTFGGSAVNAEGSYYALYPYNADATLKGTVFTTKLPSRQNAVSGSFASMLNPSVAVADGPNTSLSFKNACAVVKFSFTTTANAEISKVVFRGNNGEPLAGNVQIDVMADYLSANVIEDGASSEIELTGTFTTNTAYYFVVAPCSLENGFTITFYDSDGKGWSRAGTKPVSLKAGRILNLGSIQVGDLSSCILIDDVYHIYDADGLVAWASKDDVLTKDVVLENDIDMSGKPWNSVGTNLNDGFSGDFDGNGKTISNLSVSDMSSNNVGFFAGLHSGAKVHDVIFSKVNVTGNSSSGVVAGSSLGLVENCRVNDSQVSGQYAGAVVGNNSLQVNNCNVSNVQVDASYSGGGIAGTSYGKIEYCTVTGADTHIEASGNSARAGGIVGETTQQSSVTTSGRILKCAVDRLKVSAYWAGGIAGENGFGTIAQCVVTNTSILHESTASSCRLGGVVGYNGRGDIVASYSAYSTVGEKELTSESMGGIVGYNSNDSADVYGCYSTNVNLLGSVSGDESGIGAVAGYNSGNVISCYAVLPESLTGKLIGNGQHAKNSVEVGGDNYEVLITDVTSLNASDGTVWQASEIWNLTASSIPSINASYIVGN